MNARETLVFFINRKNDLLGQEIISWGHDLRFVRVDETHQIVLIEIEHIVFHNRNHKYEDEAK